MANGQDKESVITSEKCDKSIAFVELSQLRNFNILLRMIKKF